MARKIENYKSKRGNNYRLEATEYGGSKITNTDTGKQSVFSCDDNHASKSFIERVECGQERGDSAINNE